MKMYAESHSAQSFRSEQSAPSRVSRCSLHGSLPGPCSPLSEANAGWVPRKGVQTSVEARASKGHRCEKDVAELFQTSRDPRSLRTTPAVPQTSFPDDARALAQPGSARASHGSRGGGESPRRDAGPRPVRSEALYWRPHSLVKLQRRGESPSPSQRTSVAGISIPRVSTGRMHRHRHSEFQGCHGFIRTRVPRQGLTGASLLSCVWNSRFEHPAHLKALRHTGCFRASAPEMDSFLGATEKTWEAGSPPRQRSPSPSCRTSRSKWGRQGEGWGSGGKRASAGV